jgi:hypothetical protein
VRFLRRRKLLELPAPQTVYAAASDFAPLTNFKPPRGPRPIHVLRRGDVRQPGELVSPAALSCVPGLPGEMHVGDPGDEAARRAALARWIADPRNVLTWRCAVNRVWHHHFGRGLADTPSDLGRMGGAPSHADLLDWLAVEFRDGGGSLKKLHRLIVTSAAYRRSSRHDPVAAARDGENRLLWRMNRHALDAEGVRDAILAAAGTLDRTMGGPPVRQFAVRGERPNGALDIDYDAADPDAPEARRRSIYRFLARTDPDPFMDALDCPDGSARVARRTSSVGPLQAMALLNNHFVVRQSERLAERAAGAADPVAEALWLALGRPPEREETSRLSAYARDHGLAAACRLIFNANAFLFVD